MLYEEIGRGNYGAVYRGVDGMTGENVAVKELRTYGDGVPGSRRSPFRVAQEADLHEAVHDCPAVATVKARLRFEDKDCLVTELCTGGDLATFLKHHGPLRERQLAEVAREATSVLQICHKQAILHGDIKAANFVIRSEIDAWRLASDPTALRSGWLKAVDFGCSMRMGKRSIDRKALDEVVLTLGKSYCTYRVGTPMNWPPEVFNARFGLAADMWSMGTMLYQLSTGRMPYFTPEEQETFETEHDIALKIVTRDVDFVSSPWETFSPDAKDFLRRLLLREAAKRMTAEMTARHPFLKRTAGAQKSKTPTVTERVTTAAILSAAAE